MNATFFRPRYAAAEMRWLFDLRSAIAAFYVEGASSEAKRSRGQNALRRLTPPTTRFASGKAYAAFCSTLSPSAIPPSSSERATVTVASGVRAVACPVVVETNLKAQA